MQFQENVPLKNYTTFKIGGPARYFCAAKNKEDLIEAVSFAKKRKLPFFILGGGSNLLVSDKGFKGLAVKMENCDLEIDDNKITAGAGVILGQLAGAAAKAGLSGMEWASGIPGATIGGAVRGNAGAFDSEMKDIVVKVEALDVRDLESLIFKNKECLFSYRSSIFKKNPSLIVLSCGLNLKKEKKEKILKKMKEIAGYRKKNHPQEASAGSVFKNTESIPTALLIHQCRLTGKRIGGAQISRKHSNFIVNSGNAKAKDVLRLIDLAKKEVRKNLGIAIEEEIILLGNF